MFDDNVWIWINIHIHHFQSVHLWWNSWTVFDLFGRFENQHEHTSCELCLACVHCVDCAGVYQHCCAPHHVMDHWQLVDNDELVYTCVCIGVTTHTVGQHWIIQHRTQCWLMMWLLMIWYNHDCERVWLVELCGLCLAIVVTICVCTNAL